MGDFAAILACMQSLLGESGSNDQNEVKRQTDRRTSLRHVFIAQAFQPKLLFICDFASPHAEPSFTLQLAMAPQRRAASLAALATSISLLLLVVSPFHAVDALASSFLHDSKTTYCWRIPAAPMVKQPKWTDDVLSGEAKGCPISMEINLASTEVTAGEFLSVNWTVKLEKERFVNSSNSMRLGLPLARIVDDASGTIVDVIHSNVHSCEFGSNCDPFRMGSRFVDNTPNKVGNFSQDGSILFTSQQELLFTASGIFSVLAHIIIPGTNATSERYDFAVYQRLTVKDAVATTPTPVGATVVAIDSNNSPSGVDANMAGAADSSSSKLSSGTIIAIVLGALAILVLVLVIACMVRRRRANQGTGRNLATPVLSPLVGHQPRPLASFEKATFNDGCSEASRNNIAILGRQRLGAKPRAGTAGVAGPAGTSYLTSADPHHVIVRGKEMDIRDFDNTVDDDNTTSYKFAPPQAYNNNDNNTNYTRPQNIVDSTFSVDFVYPDTTQSDEELLRQMRRQRSDDFVQSGLDTNDSYIHYIDGENMSNANSRVFSEDSDSSEESATVDSEGFGGRFSDVTDPREDVEL